MIWSRSTHGLVSQSLSHLLLPLWSNGHWAFSFHSLCCLVWEASAKDALFLFRSFWWWKSKPTYVSVALSRHSILFLRLRLLMFIKILFDQCVPFPAQEDSLGGCYRTESALKQHGELLTCLFCMCPPPPPASPPPLQTQMGATVMLLARSHTLAKWISDSEMMAGWQWITDGGGFNVCNPCPSITELVSFEGIITLLSCCFFSSSFFPLLLF